MRHANGEDIRQPGYAAVFAEDAFV